MSENDRNTGDCKVTSVRYLRDRRPDHCIPPNCEDVTDEVAALRAERDRYKSQADEIHEAYQSLAETQDELVAEAEIMRPVVEAALEQVDDFPDGPLRASAPTARLKKAADAFRATPQQETPDA